MIAPFSLPCGVVGEELGPQPTSRLIRRIGMQYFINTSLDQGELPKLLPIRCYRRLIGSYLQTQCTTRGNRRAGGRTPLPPPSPENGRGRKIVAGIGPGVGAPPRPLPRAIVRSPGATGTAGQHVSHFTQLQSLSLPKFPRNPHKLRRREPGGKPRRGLFSLDPMPLSQNQQFWRHSHSAVPITPLGVACL